MSWVVEYIAQHQEGSKLALSHHRYMRMQSKNQPVIPSGLMDLLNYDLT
jgi:hypothetical protein